MLYKAFISYSHDADGKLAPALQSALQNFIKPWYRLRSIRVFRDKTSLAANPALWPSIETALHESEYFLLMASPQAAQSIWVAREIKWWLQNRSIETMLILLTDGELIRDRSTNDYNWERTTALPESLRGQFQDEPLYVDLRWARTEDKLSLKNPQFHSAVLDIAAPLYGRAKDELDGENVRQLKRNKRWAWSAAVALIITVSFAIRWAAEADYQSNIKFSRQLATRSELIGKQQANLLPQSVLLATEAMKRSHTLAADQAMYHSLSLLGPKPVVQKSYSGLLNLVLSPGGKYLVKLPLEGPAEVQELISGKAIASLINLSPDNKPLPAVRKVSFSSDDNYIATLSSLGISTFVWELPSGREIFRTPVNRGAILATVLSDDGNYLATGHTDGMVFLWRISTGDEVLSFSHSDPPHTIKFSPDGKFLAVSSGQGFFYGPPLQSMVRLWDLTKNQEVAQLQHVSAVTQFAFSPSGKYLATTSRVGEEQEKTERIGRVKVWETETGKKVTHVQHEEAVNTIAFTQNNKYLLTGSSDDTSRLWAVANGQEQLRIDHGNTIDLVDFIKVDDLNYFLLTAGNDNVIRLWGFYTPVEEWLRLMESPNIMSLAYNDDGQYLTTISYDLKANAAVPPEQYGKDVRVWSIPSIKEKLRLDHEHAVGKIHFSPDGRYLATLDFQLPTSKLIPKTKVTDASTEFTDLGSGSISVWEVSTRKKISHIKHPGTVMFFDYDLTGKYLATACVDGIVRVWEAISGKEVAHLEHDGWVYEVKFSPDGRYVVTSSGHPELLEGKKGKGMTTIWEWRTGREIGHLQSDYLIVPLTFSPDGKFLSAGGYDGTVNIIRTMDAQVVQQLKHDNPIWALAYSPDGQNVATGSGGVTLDSSLKKGMTTLWNVSDGKKTVLGGEHESWVLTVDFSPDGKHLASMDQDGMIRIWAAADGKKVASMKHNEYVPQAKINFSPDSKYLATAYGKKAQIWEISTGNEVARREHKYGVLWDVSFSPEGKYLATASTDTTVGLWLWHPEDLIAEACARLTQNLTRAEWLQYIGKQESYHATCANLAIPED